MKVTVEILLNKFYFDDLAKAEKFAMTAVKHSEKPRSAYVQYTDIDGVSVEMCYRKEAEDGSTEEADK